MEDWWERKMAAKRRGNKDQIQERNGEIEIS